MSLISFFLKRPSYILQEYRTERASNVTNQNFIKDIIEKDPSPHVRMNAIKNPNLTDQDFLEKRMKKESSPLVLECIIKKLENIKLLQKIEKNPKESAIVQTAAKDRIKELDVSAQTKNKKPFTHNM